METPSASDDFWKDLRLSIVLDQEGRIYPCEVFFCGWGDRGGSEGRRKTNTIKRSVAPKLSTVTYFEQNTSLLVCQKIHFSKLSEKMTSKFLIFVTWMALSRCFLGLLHSRFAIKIMFREIKMLNLSFWEVKLSGTGIRVTLWTSQDPFLEVVKCPTNPANLSIRQHSRAKCAQ